MNSIMFERELTKIQNNSEMAIRNSFLSNKEMMPKITYIISNKKYKEFIVERKYFKQLTLEDKVIMAKARIKEFIGKLPNQQIMISFSGGKDSCVLRHLVHEVQKEMGYKESKYFNCLTASEIFHPETIKFIKENLHEGDEILPPIKNFNDITNEVGYPIISKQLAQKLSHVRTTKNHRTYIRATLGLDNKAFGVLPIVYAHFLDKQLVNYKISHKCCDYIKGSVKHDTRPAFVGTTIDESRLRKNSWLKYGCIQYGKGHDICKPLSLWSEQNIWDYIYEHKDIKVSPIYKFDRETKKVNGYKRSGCVACMFGMSLEQQIVKKDHTFKNRFEMLYDTNKTAFNYYVLGKPQLWKPLIDMGIKLRIESKEYNNLVSKRENEIKKWYKNFDINFMNTLNEIEERNPGVYNKKEKLCIFNRYKKAVKLYHNKND